MEGRSTKSHRTAGMIGWTLLGATDGIKVSKLSVAWNVSLDRPEIAVALGDFVPQFDKMWENRHAGRLVSETANQVRIKHVPFITCWLLFLLLVNLQVS